MAEWGSDGKSDQSVDEGFWEIGVDDGLIPVAFLTLHAGVVWIIVALALVVAVLCSGQLISSP